MLFNEAVLCWTSANGEHKNRPYAGRVLVTKAPDPMVRIHENSHPLGGGAGLTFSWQQCRQVLQEVVQRIIFVDYISPELIDPELRKIEGPVFGNLSPSLAAVLGKYWVVRVRQSPVTDAGQ